MPRPPSDDPDWHQAGSLLAIAQAQRWLLLLAVLHVATLVLALAVIPMVALPLKSGRGRVAAMGFIPFALVLVAAFMRTHDLAKVLGWNVVIVDLLWFATCVPVAGAIVMLVVNLKATTMLRRAGVRVGPLGVSRRELARLATGHCPTCGYDLGRTPTTACPECGGTVVTTALRLGTMVEFLEDVGEPQIGQLDIRDHALRGERGAICDCESSQYVVVEIFKDTPTKSDSGHFYFETAALVFAQRHQVRPLTDEEIRAETARTSDAHLRGRDQP